MPLLVTVFVLIAVLPLTASVLKSVTVSAAASPNTALPVTVSALLLPATVPSVVTVDAVSVVLVPSDTAPL